jgi:hypothetical protein
VRGILAPRHIAEVVPDGCTRSGFEFTEYHFWSRTWAALLGIDAGPAGFRQGSLRSRKRMRRSAGTTTIATHSHFWDHMGTYFRPNPRLRFYARSNYRKRLEHLDAPAILGKQFSRALQPDDLRSSSRRMIDHRPS